MRVLFIAFITFISSAFAVAKEPLRFDAASVKPNTLDDRIVTIDVGPGGRFQARGYTLKLLIQQAYGVKSFQISGGPGWIETDRWDVEGRGAPNATRSQINQMLQAVLEERFALKFHRVEKEMQGFELSVAGSAAKMKVSAATEENPVMTRNKGGDLVATGISMPSFVKAVGSYASKPVVDKTGLTGLFDFKISWSERADQVPDAESTGVSMISALRDRLGLKLTPKKVSAEVLVVDGAEKASAN